MDPLAQVQEQLAEENRRLRQRIAELEAAAKPNERPAERGQHPEHRQIALDAARLGWWHYDPVTRIASYDQRYREIFGVTGSQRPNEDILRRLHPDDLPGVWAKVEAALNPADPQPYATEYRVNREDGSVIWVEAYGVATFEGEGAARRAISFVGTVADITARKQADANQALLTAVLQILNRDGDLRPLVAEALRLIRSATGFDGVGLRLRQGDDCPYFEESGFSEEFLKAENSLCTRLGHGRIARDAAGMPVLECTCGLVLSGRKPDMPSFTPGGSFWTNCSPELLSLPRDADPRISPRNRCIHDGYQSVALLPVRTGQRIIGLLQLNDRRPGRFTRPQIAFYEALAQNIGLALQRLTTQEALRQSEERLRLALGATELGTWDFNPITGAIISDARCKQVFGAPSDAAVNYDTIMAGLHPEDRERVSEAAQRTLDPASGGLFDVECRTVGLRDGGVLRWIRATGRASFDDSGQAVRFIGTVQDITAHKQVEERLAYLASFPEQNPNPIMEVGLEGAIRYANPTAQRLFPDLDARGPAHPWLADWAATTRLLRDDHILIREVEDGGRLWQQSLHYFTAEGYVRIYGFEITARKAAERALRDSESFYRQTLESIPGMVFTTRPDGYCDYQSQQWVDYTGVPMSEHLGNGWNRLLHPEDRPRALAAWRAAVEERAPYDLEYRVRRHTGQYEWFKVIARPIRDASGQIVRWFGMAANIDQLKRADDALRQAKAAAEDANRAKDQFIAVLSHELRTPLTPVLATVQSLQRDLRLPETVREDLEMVNRNIALEIRLVADLLDVSRIVNGKLHMEKRPTDVAESIRAAVQIVRGDLDARGQSLSVEMPAAPYLMLADEARLQQVFWNLLRNASKFSPPREHISIRASIVPVVGCPLAGPSCPVELGDCPLLKSGQGNCSAGMCNLNVAVSDHGSGIAPETLPRLFNAFEQGTEARRFGGLGLGLTICKAVVEAHGGTVAAHSDGTGCGATFTVRLPVAQCPKVAPLKRPAAPPEPPPAVQRPGRRILLVEDHADTAGLMQRLLEAEGHEVTIAETLTAALTAIEQSPPDLLISDLGLPDGSGLDLMRQLTACGRRIPGIALSGYGTATDIAQSRAAGFVEHLVKPISFDAVLAAINRVDGATSSGVRQ